MHRSTIPLASLSLCLVSVGDAVSCMALVEWTGLVFAGVFLDLVLRFSEIVVSRARHNCCQIDRPAH